MLLADAKAGGDLKSDGEEVRECTWVCTRSAAISAGPAVRRQPVNTMSTEVRDESTT